MVRSVMIAAMLMAGAGALAANAQPSAGQSPSAQPASGPPMNTFNSAYYVCQSGTDAFVLSYPDARARTATLKTSTNKVFQLRRTPVASGYMYTDGKGVQFWTDGQRVSVKGLPQPYTGCKLQS